MGLFHVHKWQAKTKPYAVQDEWGRTDIKVGALCTKCGEKTLREWMGAGSFYGRSANEILAEIEAQP